MKKILNVILWKKLLNLRKLWGNHPTRDLDKNIFL